MIKWTSPVSRPLLRQPAGVAALCWLVAITLAASIAPMLTIPSPQVTDTTRLLQPPGPGSLLGTDFLGRDILSRLLWGGRWTLQMGAVALALAVGLGLPLGLAAGSMRGRVDSIVMRLVDGLLAFPSVLLAMSIVAIIGTGTISVAVAVGLAAAPPYARTTRSAALEVLGQPYLTAARAVGCTRWRVIIRHILPNIGPSLIAFAATQLGWVLLNGAALNFLGLGVEPGTPEWGMMLAEGRAYLRDAPWASGFPGLALTLTVLAVNLVGDGIQEALW